MVDIPTRHIYKISRGGQFLGVLQNVTSQFGYTQNINAAGAQIQIDVGLSLDLSRDEVEELITEAGDTLITEAGDTLVTERAKELAGPSTGQALIRNDNDIEVVEYSSYYPSGHTVFAGYISKWAASIGGVGITITALNYGAELDNYLIQGTDTVDVSQKTGTSTVLIYNFSGIWNKIGQSFQAGSGVNNIISMLVRLSAVNASIPVDVTVSVYDNGLFTGTPVATMTRTVSSTSPDNYIFTATVPGSLTPGGWYFTAVTCIADPANGALIYYKDTGNPLATALMYNSNYAGGSGGGSWVPAPFNKPGGGTITTDADMYFETYYTSNATESPFNSQDPATTIQTILDQYISAGGTVTAGTIQATGTIVSYTFKLNTILEGIKKMAELSPSTWYWYVDVGANTLNFKERNTTADHVFTKGVHLSSMNLETTVENVKNVVYLSGGDVGGGVNLFMTDNDPASLALLRRGLERISDNRITLSSTADARMQNFLDTNASEQYQTVIEVIDTTYNIRLIEVGDLIGFANFGNFVDQLLLQVVSKSPSGDKLTLSLGTLPRRATKSIEDLLRSLNDLQTINNPNSPT